MKRVHAGDTVMPEGGSALHCCERGVSHFETACNISFRRECIRGIYAGGSGDLRCIVVEWVYQTGVLYFETACIYSFRCG